MVGWSIYKASKRRSKEENCWSKGCSTQSLFALRKIRWTRRRIVTVGPVHTFSDFACAASKHQCPPVFRRWDQRPVLNTSFVELYNAEALTCVLGSVPFGLANQRASRGCQLSSFAIPISKHERHSRLMKLKDNLLNALLPRVMEENYGNLQQHIIHF